MAFRGVFGVTLVCVGKRSREDCFSLIECVEAYRCAEYRVLICFVSRCTFTVRADCVCSGCGGSVSCIVLGVDPFCLFLDLCGKD